MQTYSTYPSYPFSKLYFTHRQVLAYLFIIVGFADIITTYFGIEYYHLHENAFVTKWLLQSFGWTGATIRTLIVTLLLTLYYRYSSDKVFKISILPSWSILIIYSLFTVFNNCYLMLMEELHG